MTETDGETLKLKEFAAQNGPKTTGTFDGGYSLTTDEEPLTEWDHLTAEEAEKWRKSAIYVSWATIICLTILGIGFVAVSIVTGSSAALGLAFDMLLDSCTSIVVLWRYFNKSTANTKGKEHKAIIILGILFIVFSIVITVKCVIALVEKTVTAEELILAGMSAVAAVVMTTLAIIKFIIARKLKSRSICCDAFSSAMGAVISYGIILSAIIYANLQIWYIDAIVGILVAVVLAGWGIWVLVNEIQEMKASG